MKPVFINRLNNFKDRFKRSFSLFAGRILTEKIENTQNLKFSSEKEAESLTSEINVAKSKIENNEENKKRFEEEINEIEEKIQKSQEDMNIKLGKKDYLKENKYKCKVYGFDGISYYSSSNKKISSVTSDLNKMSLYLAKEIKKSFEENCEINT